MSDPDSPSIFAGRKNFALKKQGCLYGLILLVFVPIVVAVVLLETSMCSFLRGMCEYDPRTQAPSSLFISAPPEQPIVQYIQERIKTDGTFPKSAASKVSTITPVLVSAEGFNADLHIYAHISVQVQYADSSSRNFRFDVMAQEDSGFFGVESSTMFARFKPIRACGDVIDPVTNTKPGDSFYCY